MRGLAQRFVIGAGVAIVLALVLGWLVDKVPALGIVVLVLAVAGVAYALWGVVSSPRKLRSAAMVALSLGAGALGVLVLTLVLDDDDATTTLAAAPLGGDSNAEVAEPTPDPTAATEPTASPDPTATSAPIPEPTTEPSPTSAPPELAVVDALDCGCAGGNELTGLDARTEGGAVVIEVGTEGDDQTGLWLWTASDPGRPSRVQLDDQTFTVTDGPEIVTSAMRSDAGWTITLTTPLDTRLAVVSDGGDRVPERGFLEADGSVVTVGDLGVFAEQLELDLAEVQRAVPSLEPAVRAMVVSLVARQTRTGTLSLERMLEGDPEPFDVVASVEWPRFGQQITRNGAFVLGAYATPDGTVLCEPAGGAPTCESAEFGLPLADALAVVRNPGQLVLEPQPAGSFDGEATTCVRVVQSPADGPPVGLSCWLPSGASALAERTGIDTVRLLSIATDADPELLQPPGVP